MTRVVLGTSDPVFAVLCGRALEETSFELLAAVPPSQLLDTMRLLAPDLLLLDADGEDVPALKTLAIKVMLVSDARVVLVAAYLAPGSPGLSALLQSIAATFVQKPQGPSSLSLAGDDAAPFVAALQAAFAAHDGVDVAGRPLGAAAPEASGHRPRSATIPPVDVDAGWESEDEPPTSPDRVGHD